MASTPPLRSPYTIHHHQHIYRMKERLAGFIQITGCNVTAIYHSFILRLSPILKLLIDYMTRNITKFKRSVWCNVAALYRFSHVRLSPFCNLLMYLISISFIGFFVLKALPVRNSLEAPKDIDMLFSAVSAATLSSLTTIEMEVFSNSQLIVLTILILAGGEAFISLLGLQFKRFSLKYKVSVTEQNLTELVHPTGDTQLKPDTVTITVLSDDHDIQSNTSERNPEMKYSAIVYLSYVVLGYLLVMHIGGTVTMLAYLYSVSDARSILTEKGLNSFTFSVFATASSFTNCGFLPTNESMALFKKHLGLLFLVVPQSLLGGALYPPALRSVLWLLKRITKQKNSETSEYILGDGEQIGYDHLFPWLHSLMLVMTVLGILLVQFVAICAMEWRSNVVLEGLNVYQKLVNNLFLAVNARHTGESTLDLATLTPAVLVLFVFIMYLPPYTTFMPFKDERGNKKDKHCKQESISFFKTAPFSQLFYLVIFVMIICITEKEKISQDPLNFNIFSIVFEVVSAYGNVGYSMGYSCSRQLNKDGACQDSWTSFAGRWSTSGKVVLIVVMLLGGLKRYSMRGGKAWKLRCLK